jgi:hypothetical protein
MKEEQRLSHSQRILCSQYVLSNEMLKDLGNHSIGETSSHGEASDGAAGYVVNHHTAQRAENQPGLN